jgi:uncharacterized OB-fold protein
MNEGSDHCYVVEGKLALPYKYFAGRVGSRFIVALRDEKKILGVRCTRCDRTFVPPRQTCERCFEDLSESWVELSHTGEVTNYTVVRYPDRHLPREVPFVLAMIKLGGADTAFPHILEGVAPEAVKVGMTVKAVFADETTHTILDIDHFEPV